MTKRVSLDFVLKNSKGLHARPAALFVQMAMTFEADISVCNLNNEMQADGKSVLSLLMLASPVGTPIRVTASGEDAEDAITALRGLIERGFDDD